MGWVVSDTLRPVYLREIELVTILQEARWGPGLVWTGVEKLAPIGTRTPYCRACRESLYRLSYPCPMGQERGEIKWGRKKAGDRKIKSKVTQEKGQENENKEEEMGKK